ncbi:MAG: hypothetical protein HOC93_07350 [Phycisphaerae bacterium]|jgi:hypothetical protein|nr:hypothetical protein [Phycisphaerae bacterium]
MAEWMRTAILIVALAISAVIGTIGAQWLGGPRGGLGPTILQTVDQIDAAIAILGVLAIASVLGLLTAKVTTAASGMFVLGFALFALAMRTQGVSEFIFSDGNTSSLMIEAVCLSVVILCSSVFIFQFSNPLKDVPLNQSGSWDAPFSLRTVGITLLISLAMLPVIWIIAVTPSKGQVIGSAVIGGIAVACLARMCMPHTQPILLFAAPTAIAAVGYAIATFLGISDTAFTQNTLSPLLFPLPIEYAAGSIMGISIGLSWGASLAEKVTPEIA